MTSHLKNKPKSREIRSFFTIDILSTPITSRATNHGNKHVTAALKIHQDNVDEFFDDRLKIIPSVQETPHHEVLFPLEHLVVLEVPVNKARVHNVSPKQCSGQSTFVLFFINRSHWQLI